MNMGYLSVPLSLISHSSGRQFIECIVSLLWLSLFICIFLFCVLLSLALVSLWFATASV